MQKQFLNDTSTKPKSRPFLLWLVFFCILFKNKTTPRKPSLPQGQQDNLVYFLLRPLTFCLSTEAFGFCVGCRVGISFIFFAHFENHNVWHFTPFLWDSCVASSSSKFSLFWTLPVLSCSRACPGASRALSPWEALQPHSVSQPLPETFPAPPKLWLIWRQVPVKSQAWNLIRVALTLWMDLKGGLTSWWYICVCGFSFPRLGLLYCVFSNRFL